MSEQRGKLITCNRCGRTIFRMRTGQGEADGGYTRWDQFEPLPETWIYESQVGHLCDECAGLFRAFIHKLMDGQPVAPAWELKTEDQKYLKYIHIIYKEEDTDDE